ncbi:flagellar M-ring protein FliF [bacterium]|nr:flagellar M-ring protein FliF [bacterium]MBU1153161.1 flagellar M-ring protein FliF [bacterium]MBU1782306.1 flagellar M-ring protein FliF [bacterium]
MKEFFLQLSRQIINIWNKLKLGQKITIIGSIVIVIGGLIILMTILGKPQYVLLYSKIGPAEAGKITSKLDEWKQEYKLEGENVLVPAKDRDKIRLNLAKEKLSPTGGLVTFDIFDTVKFTATEFERKINYLRALQGELTRTIESIEQVENARVLIVTPEKKLFIEEEKNATASIKLTLKPYATLESNQIKGIINLVASAVEGLKPENVTIIDNKGNILSDLMENEESTMEGLSSKQLELQRTEGRGLERAIRSKLGRVLGGDKVEAIVKFEMDFDRIEKKAEKYSMPGFEQLKTSEETLKEDFQGEGEKPSGPPGVEANLPGYKGITGQQGPTKYSKDERRTNYLADKEEVVQTRSPKLSKISVACFIDGTYEYDEKGKLKRDKNGKPTYHPRTKDEMLKYESLVRAAIGNQKEKIYEGVEYVVSIENVQFDRTQEWVYEKSVAQTELQRKIMSLIGLAALAIVVFGFIIGKALAIRRKMRREEAKRRTEEERRAALLALEEKGAELALPPEDKERIELERNVAKMAQEKPEIVADLLRTWLAEE